MLSVGCHRCLIFIANLRLLHTILFQIKHTYHQTRKDKLQGSKAKLKSNDIKLQCIIIEHKLLGVRSEQDEKYDPSLCVLL